MAAIVQDNPGKIYGGSVNAPVNMVNDYGNFYFYSSHLAETCLTIFGYNPEWVYASQTPAGVCTLTHYKDYDVSNHFSEKVFKYSGTVITEEEIYTSPIENLHDVYVEEIRSFMRMLRTGRMEHSYEQLVQPMLYLNAIDRSLQTGTRQAVEIAKI